MRAEIIGFVSGKGGTGKTTTAVMAGAALAALGKKVLLIELDSGLRSVDIIAGISSMAVFDLGDVLAGRAAPDKAIVQSLEYPGLSVMSAPYQGGSIQPAALKALCDTLAPHYDTLLLDCAAGIGPAFEAAFYASDRLVLVLTADPIALRDGRLISDRADEAKKPVRLLLNRVVPEQVLRGVALRDLDEAIDLAGAQLLGVIPESPTIQAAASAGRSLSHGRDKRVFDAIARRLTGADLPLVFRG